MIALLFVYRCDLWRVAFAVAFAQAYGADGARLSGGNLHLV